MSKGISDGETILLKLPCIGSTIYDHLMQEYLMGLFYQKIAQLAIIESFNLCCSYGLFCRSVQTVFKSFKAIVTTSSETSKIFESGIAM